MSNQEFSANYDDFAGSNPINALEFFVRSIISKTVFTAFPVAVTAVQRNGTESGAGYVAARPLLMPRNVDGQGIEVTTIPKLPYFRLQHGTAAIVCDPKVGDVGLAVVAKHDVSNVNGDNTSKVPATFREFDSSDSFYIGGFWGEAPTVFVRLEDDGNIAIEAPTTVTIKSASVEVEADAFTVNAPSISLNGAISGGGSSGYGATFSGTIHADKDITSGSISLQTHVHDGVESGSSTTGAPQ